MLVRGYLPGGPVITPLLQEAVGGGSGDRELTFATVFVNEPYSPNPVPIKCMTHRLSALLAIVAASRPSNSP